VTGLPEHNCQPDGEHCLGCCPGLPGGCERPSHQPPRDGLVHHGIGLWACEGGWQGPLDAPERLTLYHGGRSSIGGPSR
jgi:hypothetical protein